MSQRVTLPTDMKSVSETGHFPEAWQKAFGDMQRLINAHEKTISALQADVKALKEKAGTK